MLNVTWYVNLLALDVVEWIRCADAVALTHVEFRSSIFLRWARVNSRLQLLRRPMMLCRSIMSSTQGWGSSRHLTFRVRRRNLIRAHVAPLLVRRRFLEMKIVHACTCYDFWRVVSFFFVVIFSCRWSFVSWLSQILCLIAENLSVIFNYTFINCLRLLLQYFFKN